MKSAGKEGTLNGSLQELHIYVLLVAPLGAGHMAHQAQTSVRAELPYGKLPTTRVRRRISQFSRSMTSLVRMRVQCSLGKSQ